MLAIRKNVLLQILLMACNLKKDRTLPFYFLLKQAIIQKGVSFLRNHINMSVELCHIKVSLFSY